jgi:DNA-directed RNA polymerase specialized sigma subunit
MSYTWMNDRVEELDAHDAIPRELQEAAYAKWKEQPTKENMNNVIRMMSKLINSEVGRYKGTLDPKLLKSYAKKITADAVRSYKPKGAQLSTHVVGNLLRLHRLNYKNVQGLKASEDVQSKINSYQQAIMDLENKLNRSPKIEEIATEMKVDPKVISKIRSQMKLETPEAATPTAQYLHSDEEEILDYIYHEAPESHKKIIEWSTGYNQAPIYSNKEIAAKLNMSPVRVTQISNSLAKKITDTLGIEKKSSFDFTKRIEDYARDILKKKIKNEVYSDIKGSLKNYLGSGNILPDMVGIAGGGYLGNKLFKVLPTSIKGGGHIKKTALQTLLTAIGAAGGYYGMDLLKKKYM